MKLLVLILVAAGLAGALWYFRSDIFPSASQPIIEQRAPVVEESPAPKDPIHPLAPAQAIDSFTGELVPLPPLDDSDSYFLLALIDTFGVEVESVLVNEGLIDKFVATVDNLTRGHVAEKIRPVGRLSGVFTVDAGTDGGQFYLSRNNYERYDLLVNLVARADLEATASMYRRFYPLFQESYERLGYPNAYFNDRVVEVIDHLLATPEIDEPARLVRPHVLYEYSDAEVEALSSGQKLLLRMGGEHAATIKRALQRLRVLVTQQPG